MIPPTSIDGTDITGATIDGTDVTEITVDGQTVFTAVNTIDDFEDGNVSEYQVTTGNFAATATAAFTGSFGGELSAPGTTAEVYSDTGLQNYPAPGDTVTGYIQANSRYAATWIYTDGSDGWRCAFSTQNNTVRLGLVENGSFSIPTSTTATVNNGQWYQQVIELDANGQDITYTLKDTSGNTIAGPLNASANLSARGFGWRYADSNELYVDDWIIQ